MKLKITFVTIFFLLLLLPTFLMFSDIEKDEKHKENRLLSSFDISSVASIKKTIINIRNIYKDSYGGKYLLYNFYKKNISDPLKESPSSFKVVFGKNGWFFIGDFYDDAFSESKGSVVFNKSELLKIKENINKSESWCLKNNMSFYILIPPGKHTVYKQYLPYFFKQQKTKLDQVSSIYKPLIDIRKVLNNKDKKYYYKTDTHWNQYGAFNGYLEVMRKIKLNNHKIKSLSKYDIKDITYETFNGDIMNILGDSLKEEKPVLLLKKQKGKSVEKKIKVPLYYRLDPKGYEDRFFNNKALNKLKVLVLGDSFSENYKSFFRATFRESVFINNHTFDKEIILKEKPDILLYEVTERYLDHFLKIHQ